MRYRYLKGGFAVWRDLLEFQLTDRRQRRKRTMQQESMIYQRIDEYWVQIRMIKYEKKCKETKKVGYWEMFMTRIQYNKHILMGDDDLEPRMAHKNPTYRRIVWIMHAKVSKMDEDGKINALLETVIVLHQSKKLHVKISWVPIRNARSVIDQWEDFQNTAYST